MYIDTSHITRCGKTYTRHLLRESYRANGKVLHRTIANVSQCSEAEIDAIRLALRHKGDLQHLGTIQDSITLKQGLSFWCRVDRIPCRPTLRNSTGTGHDPRRETRAVASHGPRDRARLAPLGRASGDGACRLGCAGTRAVWGGCG